MVTKFFGPNAAPLPTERAINAWSDMTEFLQDFVENNFNKLGYSFFPSPHLLNSKFRCK